MFMTFVCFGLALCLFFTGARARDTMITKARLLMRAHEQFLSLREGIFLSLCPYMACDSS
jgi:hypothetical protein